MNKYVDWVLDAETERSTIFRGMWAPFIGLSTVLKVIGVPFHISILCASAALWLFWLVVDPTDK